MKLLKQEQDIRQQIFEYFGYQEDWRVLPFDDATEYYWTLYSDSVAYAKTKEDLQNETEFYVNDIYTQRHLSKWVYEGPEYTMILVDTHTDGNKFLQIFDNNKKVAES